MDQIPLVCVPFAGAGASFFHPWQAYVPDEIRLLTIQLPGREWRLDEDPYRDVATAVSDVFPEVAEELDWGGPVMFFGHSLGAVLAYELAHQFCATPGFDVARLFVSGSPGPWTKRARRATGLPDEEFFDQVSEFAEYSDDALRNPEVRELILPTLRADVEMHEEYSPGKADPLPAPITALRGSEDQLVPADSAAEWAAATEREFELVSMPGGHMYLIKSAAEILGMVGEAVRQWQLTG
jgi:surfactin synthase thioesterase subunit